MPVLLSRLRSAGVHVQAVNSRLADHITAVVGTMWCFYAFNLLAFTSLPSALGSGNPTVIINWASSNWMQLILLPALMVGGTIQAARTDATIRSTHDEVTQLLADAAAERDATRTLLFDVHAIAAEVHAAVTAPVAPDSPSPEDPRDIPAPTAAPEAPGGRPGRPDGPRRPA